MEQRQAFAGEEAGHEGADDQHRGIVERGRPLDRDQPLKQPDGQGNHMEVAVLRPEERGQRIAQAGPEMGDASVLCVELGLGDLLAPQRRGAPPRHAARTIRQLSAGGHGEIAWSRLGQPPISDCSDEGHRDQNDSCP